MTAETDNARRVATNRRATIGRLANEANRLARAERYVEAEFLSADPPHPVVAALLSALGLPNVLALYEWTDELSGVEGPGSAQQQAVGALRSAAAVWLIAQSA